jgi:glycosyltransferase involved in cell wall biosynthesis
MNLKFSIIITTKKYSDNLKKTINSIYTQIYSPIEIIIVSNDRIFQTFNVNKKVILKKYVSKIKNQVFQRNIGFKKLSEKSDIVLQLDDRIILDQRCLYELNKFWHKMKPSVIGVGLNQVNPFKERGFLNKITYYLNLRGKVLINGMSIDYSSLEKDLSVMWLKGGLSSWRVNSNKNKKFYDRKFPLWKWSIFEDVEFSISHNKNSKLIVSHKSKAEVIERKDKINFNHLIYRGSLHTFSQKRLVNHYFKNKIYFFSTVPILVIISFIISILTFNLSKIIYNLGRLKGFFIINFN